MRVEAKTSSWVCLSAWICNVLLALIVNEALKFKPHFICTVAPLKDKLSLECISKLFVAKYILICLLHSLNKRVRVNFVKHCYKRFQAIWCQLKVSNNVESHCFETTSSRKQRQCKAASLKAGTGAPSNQTFVAT